MLRTLLRIILTIIGFVVGYGAYSLLKYILEITGNSLDDYLNTTTDAICAGVFAIIFGFIFYRLAPEIKKKGNEVANKIESDLEKTSAANLVSSTLGLIAGLVIAYLISKIYSEIELTILTVVLNVISYCILGFIGFVVGGSKGKEVVASLRSFRASAIPSGRSKSKSELSPKILDTSVIIDGRIADIMATGFIEGSVVIPDFVLVELRHIADSSDSLKRNRGRRGLDVLKRIETDFGIEIYDTTQEHTLEEIPEVDVKLLKLAHVMKGKVVTNDFNLNKVASIQGVDVLNVNELANTMKSIVLPGEPMVLTLVKEGTEKDQAVAYLDDGTMIVVEEGRRFIGQTIKVIVSSVLQTAAGRMVFAKPAGNVK